MRRRWKQAVARGAFALIAGLCGWPLLAEEEGGAAFTLISETDGGEPAGGPAMLPAISRDGRWVAFESSASGLAPEPIVNSTKNIFVFDTQAGVNEWVSITSTGDRPDAACERASISGDGRFVVFQSEAANLVPNDTNGKVDVFLRDRDAGTTQIIAAGLPNGASEPVVSPDGRFVVFKTRDKLNSTALDGLPEDVDNNGIVDLYIWERSTGRVRLVTRTPANAAPPTPHACSPGGFSDDGRWLVFESTGALVAGDTNGKSDIFVQDLTTGATSRVSVGPEGAEANNTSLASRISGNGRFVLFRSTATNLTTGDSNNAVDLFLHDRDMATTRPLLTAAGTLPAGSTVGGHDLSADGRVVVFASAAADWVPGDANNRTDIFRMDTETGATFRVSVYADGGEPGMDSENPVLSADGTRLAFDGANNFLRSTTTTKTQVWTVDLTRVPAGTISIGPAEQIVAEDSGNVELTVRLQNVSAPGIGVGYRVTGTAFPGNDFVLADGTIEFDPGETERTLHIPLIDDAEEEETEEFRVELYALTDGGVQVVGTSAAVVIVDDDAPMTFTLESAEQTVGESAGEVRFVITRSGGGSQYGGVDFATVPGTAQQGTDYADTSGYAYFEPVAGRFDALSRVVIVPLIDDLVTEPEESFSFILTPNTPADAQIGPVASTTVHIVDDTPSATDRYGHALYISQLSGTTAPQESFTCAITVINPSATASFAGRIQLVATASRWAGSTPIPADTTLGFYNLPPIAPGSSRTINVSGNCPAPTAGIDRMVDARVLENTVGGELEQDRRMIFRRPSSNTFINPDGTARTRSPVSGGVPTTFAGTNASSFAAQLAAITISGPATVTEGETGVYTASATLSDGQPAGGLAVDWSSSAFAISAGGRFSPPDVSAATTVTLTATVRLGGVTKTASRQVTVALAPLPVFSGPALLNAARDVPLSHTVQASNRPRVFAVDGDLPPGVTFASSGKFSGTPTVGGIYPLTVRATNLGGATQREFVIAVVDPGTLTVTVEGEGTVTRGFLGTTTRFPGTIYTVTATPKAGFLFAGWSGDLTASTPRLSFEMTPAISLTATFVQNPYLTRKGAYTGLFRSDEAAAEGFGLLRVAVGAKGTFTASLRTKDHAYSWRGTLDAAGNFTGQIAPRKLPPLDIALHCETSGTAQLTGTLASDERTLEGTADPALVFTARNPAPHAGSYNASLTLPDEAAAGFGLAHAQIVVSTRGKITGKGRLPDGQAFTFAGPTLGRWNLPVQVFGAGRRHYLAGELLKSTGVEAFEGDVFWSRTAQVKTGIAAVAEPLTLTGARITTPVVTIFSGAVEFAAGGESENLPLEISSRLAGSVAEHPDIKLKFDQKTGLFRGEWKETSTGARRTVSGLMLSAEEGIGLFPFPNGTAGSVRISLPGEI